MDPRHLCCDSVRSLVAFELAFPTNLAPIVGQYTCVPRGSGERIGVDRDGDGAWDGDERDAYTDPTNPASRP